jgi:hypothetical protein
MTNEKRRTTLFTIVAICALMFAVTYRTSGLYQANAIAADSRVLQTRISTVQADLRDRLTVAARDGSEIDQVAWDRIQREIIALHPQFLANTQFQWQRFDPAARVRLLPGADGQPGTIDFDDNANGVIDDPGELGATYSDDQCIIEASESAPSEIKPSVVLQLGAYVPVSQMTSKHPEHPDRLLVQHQGGEDAWSFVFEWPAERSSLRDKDSAQ